MWCVMPVTKSTHELTYVTSLTHEETALLKQLASVTQVGETLNHATMDKIHRFVSQVKRRHQWITCDCQNEPPCVMTVCHRGQSLYLRRVASFAPHQKTCIFYREASEQQTQPTRKKPSKSALFSMYRESVEVAVPSVSIASNSNSHRQSLSKLARRLYQLLDMAGLLVFTVTDGKKISAQYADIHAVTQKINLTQHHKLSEYFWTHPNSVTRACLHLQNTQTQWKKSFAPHGFLLVVATSVDKHKIICDISKQTYEIHVENAIKLSSGRLGPVSAPFLVLVSIARLGPDKAYCPLDAFAVPVYASYLLMPVESHYERLFLKGLISLANSLSKKGLQLNIEKPMFDIQIEGEGVCRPDFILKSHHRTIVLEVMGSHEPEYLQRKEQTHGLMSELGALLTFDAHKANLNDTWDDDFSKLAKIIYAKFLSKN